MLECPNCKTLNTAEDSRYCKNCGEKLPDIKICPKCFYSTYDDDEFCVGCGTKLVYDRYYDIDYLNHMAGQLQLKGEYDKVVKIYDEILLLAPQDSHILEKKEQFKFIVECDEQLKIFPNDLNVLCYKGDALRDMMLFNAAEECYDKALSISLDPYTFRKKINILMDMKNYYDALEYCDTILNNFEEFENDLDLADIFCLKTDIYTETEEFDKALECCNRACEIDPNYKTAYDSKAYLSITLGNYDEAMECCEKSIELDEDFYPWYMKGEIYFDLKEYDKAMECCEKAKEFDSTYEYLIKLINDIKIAQNKI